MPRSIIRLGIAACLFVAGLATAAEQPAESTRMVAMEIVIAEFTHPSKGGEAITYEVIACNDRTGVDQGGCRGIVGESRYLAAQAADQYELGGWGITCFIVSRRSWRIRPNGGNSRPSSLRM